MLFPSDLALAHRFAHNKCPFLYPKNITLGGWGRSERTVLAEFP